ncbi:unnamed protein product, partial [Darwinula stevensoni]
MTSSGKPVIQETVYGTGDDSHMVMSEKVQSLAGSIYQEFEAMIAKYDEDVVKNLMPLVVNVLECLDLAYTENQEHEVELELLREDNEQLVTQYEREKQLRKASEQVACRLEEKEAEMKAEYNKLHSRYTELFKTHMDYMERTKILTGTDRSEHMGSLRGKGSGAMNIPFPNRMSPSGLLSFGFSSLENQSKSLNSHLDFISTQRNLDPTQNLKSELQEGGTAEDKKNMLERGMGREVENLIMENNELLATNCAHKVPNQKNGKRVIDFIFSTFRNALNIVKDDLIARVDELTSEQDILREEIQSLEAVKSRLKMRIQELEEELKKAHEEQEQKSNQKPPDDEDDVPMAQRKRFTRVEMARVLMERNQYKEKLMELQDAVRWTEMMRAAKQETADPDRNRKQSIWKLCHFSSHWVPWIKMWCAAGVNLTGGKTRDGGDIVGASVFYSQLEESGEHVLPPNDAVDSLDHELKEHERMRQEGESLELQLSSLVWICTSTHAASKVSVIDANNPADILEAFRVCSSRLLCIASVPGEHSAKVSDYPVHEELSKIAVDVTMSDEEATASHDKGKKASEEEAHIGEITFVSCATGSSSVPSPVLSESPTHEHDDGVERPTLRKLSAEKMEEGEESTREGEGEEHGSLSSPKEETSPPRRRLLKEPQGLVKDGLSELPKDNLAAYERMEKMTSVLPTMWMGAQNGGLYVHSAISQWRKCLHSIKLRDAVLSIVHVKGRVLVALADGSVAIFHRAGDGQWDLHNYHLLDLGKNHSIRCMTLVHSKVWCGFRNRIHVVDPRTFVVEKSFDAHPRRESQVRLMTWVGDGVWVSIRLDSTLRLYHAHTHQHLQDVDIEPYVSKMLGTGKLGFSFVRITALLISCNRLWIGTGNGVIISVPLSETSMEKAMESGSQGSEMKLPGAVVRVYSDPKDQVTPGSFIPFCSMTQAQLSFHGHRDAVKFFAAVPG